MSYAGQYLAIASTMASGGTSSTEVDLGRPYKNVYLSIPVMASSTNGLRILGSDTSGGTFRVITHASINSATVATNEYVINSAASSVIVPVPAGLRFVKVNTAATVDAGAAFKFICGD